MIIIIQYETVLLEKLASYSASQTRHILCNLGLSLLCSQQLATYPEPDQSILRSPLFPEIHFRTTPTLRPGLVIGFAPSCLPTKTRAHLSPSPFLPHALPSHLPVT